MSTGARVLCRAVFVFTAGRVDRFVAFQVARLVRRWALLTGKTQVPLAYGVLSLGSATALVMEIQVMLRIQRPFFTAVAAIAVIAWGFIVWQNWRVLRLLERIKLEDGGITIDFMAAFGLRAGLLGRRIWAGMGLFFILQGWLLGVSSAIAPAALGISGSLYVMMCITPSTGTPVWVRGRERLRDAAKRLAPVPVPSPS